MARYEANLADTLGHQPQGGFVWGPNGQKLTRAQAERYSQVAEALMAKNSAPQNLGQGLARVGDALVANAYSSRADQAENENHKRVADALLAAQKGNDRNGYLGVMSDDWASPEERSVAGAMLNRDYQQQDQQTEWSHQDQQRQQDRGWAVEDRDAHRGQFQTLTADEAAARGLSPTGSYQLDTLSGKVDPIGGGGQTINVGAGENQYDKTLNENLAKGYIDLQNQAASGQSTLSTLNGMQQQMADPNFYSGVGSGQVQGLKRLAAGFGLDPEGASSMEGFM